ncbi:MAG: hypothetical protein V4675_18400 [Verrucomicrobiota bacterium]
MTYKSKCFPFFWLPILTLVILVGVRQSEAGEVVLHQGEERGMTAGGGNPIRRFREIFYIDEQLLAKQKEIDLREVEPPIPMAEAAVSVARRFELGKTVMWKAELINQQAKTTNNLSKGVFFHVLQLGSANGRDNYVVLMDGTIILPRKKFID